MRDITDQMLANLRHNVGEHKKRIYGESIQKGGTMAKDREDREPVVVTIDDVADAGEVTITKGGTTLKFDRNQAVALSRFFGSIQWGGTTKERY